MPDDCRDEIHHRLFISARVIQGGLDNWITVEHLRLCADKLEKLHQQEARERGDDRPETDDHH